jgi:hypothetical protein
MFIFLTGTPRPSGRGGFTRAVKVNRPKALYGHKLASLSDSLLHVAYDFIRIFIYSISAVQHEAYDGSPLSYLNGIWILF